MDLPRIGAAAPFAVVLLSLSLGCSSNGSSPGSSDAASGMDAGVDARQATDSGKDTAAQGKDSSHADRSAPDTGGLCIATSSPCTTAADCPVSTSACTTAACQGGCCGGSNVVAGTACSDNGGKVCNGEGTCVTCTMPTDCAAQATACVANTCTSNTCGTTSAAAGVACTDNGGKVCSGAGTCVACTLPSDCPAPSTSCVMNSCTGNACGTTNTASGAACNDSGGRLCDGNGACVACLAATDCPAQTTVCKVNNCSATTCGATNALKGTACTDSGGIVCDGNGSCVATSCTDGVLDGNETAIDCGGSCAGCADGLTCKVGSDCVDLICTGGACAASSCSDGVKNGNETGIDCGGSSCDAQGHSCATGLGCAVAADCQSGLCQGGTCALRPNGNPCTGGAECQNGSCVDGFCCNTACAGTCQACSAVLTGQADGTCANVTGGTPAPPGQCTVGPTCGNDGNCSAVGTCEQVSAGSSCGAASCSNGQLTAPSSCNGSGTCASGSTAACAGHFICASATACKTACASDSDCEGGGLFCQNPGATGVCAAKDGSGGACTANDECTSGACGVSGSGTHCCSAVCGGGVCGATDCDATGACVYPGNSVAPPSLQTPGDCQKIVCNGSDGVTSVDDATDLPTPSSACLTNPACVGVPLAPSFTPAPTGSACTAADPAAHVCGDTTNANIAGTCVECNVNADCPSPHTCNSSNICQ